MNLFYHRLTVISKFVSFPWSKTRMSSCMIKSPLCSWKGHCVHNVVTFVPSVKKYVAFHAEAHRQIKRDILLSATLESTISRGLFLRVQLRNVDAITVQGFTSSLLLVLPSNFRCSRWRLPSWQTATWIKAIMTGCRENKQSTTTYKLELHTERLPVAGLALSTTDSPCSLTALDRRKYRCIISWTLDCHDF